MRGAQQPAAPTPASGLAQHVRDLDPGYFALVMATGVLSNDFYLLGMPAVAWALFAINLVAFAVLVALNVARLVLHPARLWADLNDYMRSPGFFTVVAGMCILGNQFVIVAQAHRVAAVLWAVAGLLWLGLVYAFFLLLIVKPEKPALADGINGGWLILVVSTQALATLAALALPQVLGDSNLALFGALVLFLTGDMLYLLVIELIFYRLLFFAATPQQLGPPYWINLGAAAITTLAGSTLILNAGRWPFLGEILPFLKGFTLFFWAFATWWLPLLVLLGLWRHGVRRVPLRYDPAYWRMVFPLGVYTAATLQLAKATGLDFLAVIPQAMIVAAAVAWLLTFSGMVVSWLRPNLR